MLIYRPDIPRLWPSRGESETGCSMRMRIQAFATGSLTGLLDKPEDDPEVVRERREIGKNGWAAQLLRHQHSEGQWVTPGTSAFELYRPTYIATNWQLLVLADLGVPGKNPRIAKPVKPFLRRFSGPSGGLGGRGSKVCFTGNAVRLLVRFGRLEESRVGPAVDWLVRHQKSDGGWHCFPSRTGTLDAWEAMAAFAALPPAARTPPDRRAIERGAEFYLDRGLLRGGRIPYAPWVRLHYPVQYYYDLLVGLEVLTALGYGDDPPGSAPRWIASKPNGTATRRGTWTRFIPIRRTRDTGPRPVLSAGLEVPGRPSRWITTTALTVIRRAGR